MNIAIITARQGSKRIKGKNIKNFLDGSNTCRRTIKETFRI
ncbi:MAG: hypothetical protein HVK26_01615 [Pelagibacteraceae bacterium]|nr:hypothetical protein [Pelagibacteraceae bacterium]MBO6491155.1 hypothetical protein [Pelagibacteraceae bacterium]